MKKKLLAGAALLAVLFIATAAPAMAQDGPSPEQIVLDFAVDVQAFEDPLVRPAFARAWKRLEAASSR